MICCEWIVCERTSHWAAALRLALARDAAAGGPRCRLREVRHLAELTVGLADRPASVVAIEIHHANLGDALDWLARDGRQFPQARVVALVDHSLRTDGPESASADRNRRCEICHALREAGALEIAQSPRRLSAVIAIGRHHAASVQLAGTTNDNSSYLAQIAALLPWQAT